MRNLQKLSFHPIQEKVVDILCAQTQNSDRLFFRIVVAYFFCKLASMMRCNIFIAGRGTIPINMYAINLAVSGAGKGHSINIIEDQLIHMFQERFLNQTFPLIAIDTLEKLSIKRANRKQSTPEKELTLLENEFEQSGEMVFSFDSATSAAAKQLRHKLLMAGSGSMNMELDEVGHNLLGNIDVLTTFLELFDMGKLKSKLVKNTKENTRTETLYGSTPTNILLFGTPTKLLNGSKVEDEFYEMLETGYARRSFFGYSRTKAEISGNYTPEQIYDIFNDTSFSDYLMYLSDDLAKLADIHNFNITYKMEKEVALIWLSYKLHCENEADRLSEYEEVKKAELKHRYFKVAKLAGAYAFIGQELKITEDNLYQAIALAEQSGEAFSKILNRDRPYVKLASYICSIGREVTHADLVEDLPFYKGSEAQKRDMLTLAIAHGYRNNMIIKKEEIDGIDFLSGKSLAETDLHSLTFSYSKDITCNFKNENHKFDKLWYLVTRPDFHWVSHHLRPLDNTPGGYRDEDHVKPGFNMIVLDVDEGTSMDMAQMLLKDITWLMHTTKRHTSDKNRYRIIVPISHILELDSKEYKEFMNNIYNWLPFTVDTQTAQRARKWETYPGTYTYNSGQLLDALQFIPKTKKANEAKAQMAKQTNLTALERWFINNIQEGNRNNQLAKYGFALADAGQDIDTIKNNVLALNSKLDDPLPEVEILSTILVSVSRKISNNTVT